MAFFCGQNRVNILSKIPVSSAPHASSECALFQAGCAAVASSAGAVAGHSVGYPFPSYQTESSAAGAWSHLSPRPETEPVPAVAAAVAGAGHAGDAADGADAGTSL